MNRLTGRVAVITGAARGIGRALTEGFMEEGATVVAVDRSWDGVEELRDEWQGSRSVMATTFDITDRAQVESVAADVLERFGTVDVLVNNVGLRMRDLYPQTWRVTVLESTDADWEASFAVHVLGTLGVIRAFVPPMLAQRRGSIVNIGSVDSLTIRNSPYASTKAALTSVSRYLAQELREQNIAVNVALPGGTMSTGSQEHLNDDRAQGLPTGQLLRPAHVLPLVLHFAEQDASGDTGQVLSAVDWNASHDLGGAEVWRADEAF